MKKPAILTMVIFLFTVQLFAQSGEIRELSGTVELKQTGSTAFVAARVGDQIARDTIVSTGFRSSALIQVGSSSITVRPLTRLSLAELRSSAGTETINVSLQTGRVRVDVNPPAGTRTSMEVRGPSATASVRGTSFEFDTYSLTVLKGNVAFYPSRDTQETRGSIQGSQAADGAGSIEASQISKVEKAVLVRAGAASELMASGRAADPIALSKEALIPAIKVSIAPDVKVVSVQEEVAPRSRIPLKLKSGKISLSFTQM